MHKLLTLIPLIFPALLFNPNWDHNASFNIEDDTIVSIKEEMLKLEEIRVYCSDSYHKIAENVFDSCSKLKTLMLTYNLNEIGAQNWPTSLTSINYTGGEDEWSLLSVSLPNNVEVNYYANDEGFVYYWDSFVRINETTNLCDSVSKEDYVLLKQRYDTLSDDDLSVVSEYIDKAGSKISSSMKYLASIYGDKQETRRVEKEVSSSLMIALIITAASVGMTFIALLYLLKEKKIID